MCGMGRRACVWMPGTQSHAAEPLGQGRHQLPMHQQACLELTRLSCSAGPPTERTMELCTATNLATPVRSEC